ncbi:MAG: discoidin domain-containing protein [Candidatus Daviesbacteria bacterium]|nr:MAG: discoidin domain-containing protein [Candidatus Daviesbacteria bacterium]
MLKKVLCQRNLIWCFKQAGPLFLIFLITFLAYHKTFFFYFWHDDFSILYNAANKICPFNWPFNSYCPVFENLYQLFNFNPAPYFILGFILKFILGCFSFFLCKNLFGNKILSLLLASLIVSVGGEDSLLSFYSISENIGISFLLLILLLINRFNENKSVIYLIASGLLFFLSLYIFPIYSTGHILIILPITLYLFWSRFKRLTLILLTFFILITLVTYIWVPYKQSGQALQFWQRAGGHKITEEFIKLKFTNFIQTTGSFVLTDYLESKLRIDFKIKNTDQIRLLTGYIINIAFLVFIWINRKDKKIFGLGIFAFLWIITQYIPKGLVTTTGLGSTDRHIFYPYIGFVLALGMVALRNLKIGQIILTGVLILNLLQTNQFFGSFENDNRSRSHFYQQLRDFFPIKPDRAIIFIDSPRGEKQLQLGDFVRVGMHPSQSSLATKLNIKMENLILLTDSSDLIRYYDNPKFDRQFFYSFYWDGDKLVNTTNQARDFLQNHQGIITEVNVASKTQFIKNSQNMWTGKNNGVSFTFDTMPILPTHLSLILKATDPEIPLPYTQSCFNCTKDPMLFKKVLNSITISRSIKQTTEILVSNSDTETTPNNLIDFDLNSFWRAERSPWFQGIKPVISLKLKEPTDIDGVIIYASSKFRIPKSFEVFTDGKKVDYNLEYSNGKSKILFKNTKVKNLSLKILSTEGDSPLVEEISFIPTGYSDINLDTIDQIRHSPAGAIETPTDREVLKNYTFFGVDSCIKWQSPGFGEGMVNLLLKIDGSVHTYSVILPAMGINKPTLTIDCLTYPVDLELISASLIFLGNNK